MTSILATKPQFDLIAVHQRAGQSSVVVPVGPVDIEGRALVDHDFHRAISQGAVRAADQDTAGRRKVIGDDAGCFEVQILVIDILIEQVQ